MSIELKMLIFSVFLLLIQLVMQVVAGIIQNGLANTVSARDEHEDTSGYAARFERAFYNMLETFPVFVALVLIVQVTESWTVMTALGAQLYFWGRIFYLPAYIAGIPFVRTFIWVASVAGMVIMAWPLLAQVT
ncbi:MAG: MAPEG family protein [Rhizobiales bacterium]|nr:MAPEG family protein [Hyphomicrobiales bacterium]